MVAFESKSVAIQMCRVGASSVVLDNNSERKGEWNSTSLVSVLAAYTGKAVVSEE